LPRGWASNGANGIALFDDWGTQEALMVSPAQWRELFKPLYRRHFELCHELGLHVFFHSCGQVTAIVNDLIEAGADMLNLSQMTLYQESVAAIGAGRACFVCPVDFQRTLYADPATIEAEIARMIELFGGGGRGGIIGQTEGYVHLGCSPEITRAIADSYCRLGGRPALHRAAEGLGAGGAGP
jgi:uroporphyrinogen-III decarboxylase